MLDCPLLVINCECSCCQREFIVTNLICHVEHQDKLNKMVEELSTVLAGVKHEQEYMEVRDKVHRESELTL